MAQNLETLSWKDALPNTFKWLDTLSLSLTNSPVDGALHIVAIKCNTQLSSDPNPSVYVDAPDLPEIEKNHLESVISTMGYRKVIEPILVSGSESVGSKTSYLGVPVSESETTPYQKAAQIGLDAAAKLKSLDAERVVVVSGGHMKALDIFEGLVQGLYKLSSFKGSLKESGGHSTLPSQVSILGSSFTNEMIEDRVALCQSLALCRMLGDAPGNWLTSERFAEIAQGLAKDLGISCDVKGREEIKQLGMGAFTSVANGTPISPKLITLEIKGTSAGAKTVALAGKGLTFDAGGMCLKPSNRLDEMKYDMCGGGAVLASAYYLAKSKPRNNVVCLIGAVENMLGEHATRAGDIVTAMNGKTIEVLNTDAEGRLVLADVLYYAQKNWDPDLLIDVATLTGAVIVSLGSFGSGYMTNNEKAGGFIKEIAKSNGEPIWELPLWPELPKEMRSKVADLRNIPGSNIGAGTITAGAFLQEFVEKCPWVHIDIAGTGWDCKATGIPSGGGSGFSVKTLAKAAQHFEG